MEVEATEPALQGERQTTTVLVATAGGMRLSTAHDNLPSGVSLRDDEIGWRDAPGRLAHMLGAAGAGAARDMPSFTSSTPGRPTRTPIITEQRSAEGAMSKTLLLVRHAKSSWDDPDLADYARPLNKRGKRDAAAMAQRVAHRPDRPERIVTSPATRARRTAEAMAAALGFEPESLVVDPRIYDATVTSLLEVIRSLDDRHARVMLVGHHPGITETVNALTDAALEKMPTCSVAEMRVEVPSWADVREGGAVLIELLTPKDDVRE